MKDGDKRTYRTVELSNLLDGSETVKVTAEDEDIYFVVAATPKHFRGNQKFSYRIKIDRKAR